jgi:hypothetical protein
MKKQNLQNKYPVFSIEIEKKECVKSNVKEILNFLKSRIEEHPVAQFISIFDHYSHTKKMEEGEIATDILAAEVILFCFGKKLETPLQLAVRPRPIGIAEMKESFVISFLEAPNPVFNEVMEKWIKSLIKEEK